MLQKLITITAVAAAFVVLPSAAGAATPMLALGQPAFGGHSCVLTQSGKVYCWGSNAIGQLGIGSVDSSDHYTPVKVAIGAAQSLALGGNHTCVRLISGPVDCFGGNLAGQQGVSDNILTLTGNPTPLLSGLPSGALAIAAGGPFTCVIVPDGRVQCVGENSESQLGVAATAMDHTYIAVTVPGLNVYDLPVALPRLTPAKPKLKFKKSRAKIAVSGRVKVTGAGAPCAGRVTNRLERKSGKKYRKVVSATAKLNVKKGACGFDVKLKLAKKYAGRKLYLHVALPDGANALGFDKRYSAKVKRIKF